MRERIINDFKSFCRLYRYSSKEIKSKLLDEFCRVHDCHRKSAIRKLRKPKGNPKTKPGPKKQYKPEEVLEPLKRLWLATDQMCSKRLHSALPLWLPHYSEKLSEKIKKQLLSMSPATIDRLLHDIRKIEGRKRRCGTKPGTLLKNKIEIKTDHWDVTEPGFMEADTVAHCGSSLSGDFIWSITLVDIFSEWTENFAVWNKGAGGILNGIKEIEGDLPFILRGFDSDNGSEFLNYHLLHYFHERNKPVQFTRSRPYRKDDNAHVEQRNWTHVRQLLGYARFDDVRLVTLINDIYRNEWRLLNNFFCPSMKLIEKVKINSKYRKKYSKPQTPYERLQASNKISARKKEQLKKQFEQLNPFILRQGIERKLKKVFALVELPKKSRTKI